MSMEANKALFRRVLDVVNGADMALMEGLVADDAILRSPAQPEGMVGLEGFKGFVTKLRGGFPDLKTTIEELVAEGDHVVGRVALRGTHTRLYRGIPATGRTIAATELIMMRIVDGKVRDAWQVLDVNGIMQQLGLMPAGDPPRVVGEIIVGAQRLYRALRGVR